MYLDHFGLDEAPFRITPHTDFFFDGANRGATLDALLYAVTHDEGIVKVSGEVGSGKTMLCRVLIERLPQNVEIICLANPSLSRDDILFTLADELHVNLATNRVSAVLRALQEHLIERYAQGRQVVVLIDEAHAMPMETLEEIRLLSNLDSNRHKLLQIVLFGQPELNDNLNRNEMRQLKERITHNFTLEPLVRSDVAEYVNFRMRAAGYKGPDVFSAAALKAIAAASLGLTRRINILADKALLAAFAENTHQITAAHVRAAVRDAEFRKPALQRLGPWLAAAAATLLFAGAAAAYLWRAAEPTAAPPAAPAAEAMAPRPAGGAEAAPQATPPSPANPPSDHHAPAAPPATTETPAAPVRPVEAPPASNAAATPVVPVAPAAAAAAGGGEHGLGRLTRERLEDTRAWLAAAEPDHWFIQLLITDADRAQHVENFLARAVVRLGQPATVRVYTVELKGSRRLGVIYGDYATREGASRDLAQLPAELRAYGPYPRQVRRLRD